MGHMMLGKGYCSSLDQNLYEKNLSVPQSQYQNSFGELGDVADGDRLRCLHGKVDTTISCVCTLNCWLRPVFWVHCLWL